MNNIPQNTEKLYWVEMLGADLPSWEYEKDVHLSIFVTERPDGPPMPYEKAIKDYDPKDEFHYYPESCIDEKFTLEEAQSLKKWLVDTFNSASCEIKEVDLPICMNTAGLGAIAVGGLTDFYMIEKLPGYDLPFRVWGYYNRRESEELRRHAQSRKLNRQIEVRARDGQIKYAWNADRIEEQQHAVTVVADVTLSNEQIAAELRKIADQFEQNNADIQEVRQFVPDLEFDEEWSCLNYPCGICGQGCESGHGVDVVLKGTRDVVCPSCVNELLTPDLLADLEKKRKEANERFATEFGKPVLRLVIGDKQYEPGTNRPSDMDDIPF